MGLKDKIIGMVSRENIQKNQIRRQEEQIQKNNRRIEIIQKDKQLTNAISNENLRESNIIRNEIIIERNRREIERQEFILQKEKESSNSEFNFYKLKTCMDKGMSLVDALNMCGMVPNVMYNMDYNGNKICRIHNINVDDICINLKQNKVFEKLLIDKKAIMCIVGNPYKTDFEIGILVADTPFGAILFTRYKNPESYILDVGGKLIKQRLIGYGVKNDITLSKSFVKIAFNSAIRISLNDNSMSDIDNENYKELMEYNPDGANNMNYLLKALGVIH